ncbi:hypothetical protein [Flavobacterium sp.]|jgi:hypothetical protein|uniref:hypothetical protein n=1 Tax=Flavobacterium sp. TaxID=239 RepID=UPI0037C0B6A5
MKKIFYTLLIALQFVISNAQETIKLDDFGRIALNTYVSNDLKIPLEAKNQLEIKLKQIASKYGMAGTAANPRFIITASVSITTKDIIAGPPQMIAQNMDITLFVGDAFENKVFANTIITSKGVGTNENKAFIDAIKQINVQSKVLKTFLEEAKTKIVSYYATQCDFIINKAEELRGQESYNEALYNLALVPDICKDCYFKCLNEMSIVYDLKINSDGKKLLDKAITTWAANPNQEGANEATEFIKQINPKAKCIPDASKLLKSINSKLIVDEKERLRKEEEYEKRQQIIDAENAKQQAILEKERINAYRQIAVEYAKNQPAVIYRNVYWRY